MKLYSSRYCSFFKRRLAGSALISVENSRITRRTVSVMSKQLQSRVNEFFSLLGVQKHGVKVITVQDSSLIASARGISLWNYPVGQIILNSGMISLLSREELDFILAHEAIHIFYNHLPLEILTALPQSFLDALAEVGGDAMWLKLTVDFIKVVVKLLGGLPPEAALTKNHELQADVLAICLTGNRTAAVEAMNKLVDYDLNKPSHLWEVLGVKLPVMTMKERLTEIQRQTRELEKHGYVFK